MSKLTYLALRAQIRKNGYHKTSSTGQPSLNERFMLCAAKSAGPLIDKLIELERLLFIELQNALKSTFDGILSELEQSKSGDDHVKLVKGYRTGIEQRCQAYRDTLVEDMASIKQRATQAGEQDLDSYFRRAMANTYESCGDITVDGPRDRIIDKLRHDLSRHDDQSPYKFLSRSVQSDIQESVNRGTELLEVEVAPIFQELHKQFGSNTFQRKWYTPAFVDPLVARLSSSAEPATHEIIEAIEKQVEEAKKELEDIGREHSQ